MNPYGPDYIPLSPVEMVIYGIIACLGIVGNSLVIYVLAYMVRSHKRNTNILLINQSVIDLVASIFLVLCYLVPQPYMKKSSTEWLVCYIWNSKYFFWATTVTSTLNLLCLTYERYYAILHPVQYRNQPWLVWPRSILLATIPWILGYLFQSYFLAMHYIDKKNVCMLHKWKSHTVKIVYSVVQILLAYILPSVLMVFAYVRIYRAIRVTPAGNAPNERTPLITQASTQQGQSTGNRHARRGIIKTLVIVCATFNLCWLPNQFCYTYYNVNNNVHYNVTLYGVTICIAFLNMCANPFIYTFQYRGFRQGFQKAMPCLARFVTRSALQESE